MCQFYFFDTYGLFFYQGAAYMQLHMCQIFKAVERAPLFVGIICVKFLFPKNRRDTFKSDYLVEN